MESMSSRGAALGDASGVLEGFAEQITHAREAGGALSIVGGGTKSFYGRTSTGAPLTTGDFHGIVEYEPAELVVTALAGTRLDALAAVLAGERQMLAFEPPSFGAASTIGGVVAAGLSGPRRPYAGAVRDCVLGIELMTADAAVLRFGGQVMKNVAGYDVSRLMAGSLGTLGLLLSVSLKVLPLPENERTLVWRLSPGEARRLMLDIGRKPWPVSAMAYAADTLRVRLSGSADAVDEAAAALSADAGENDDYWRDLNDQRLDFFDDSAPLWRLSVPPAAARISLPGMWLCDWGGALRWLKSAEPAAVIREHTRAVGGHATLFRGHDEMPFTPLDKVNATIHRRLKAAFDPAGIFNPGRLYADL
jgi:glycolate oxidase FAD binding subunit